MDRDEWGEIVGDRGMIQDDLRWALFQAERSVRTTERDEEHYDGHPDNKVHRDNEVYRINQRRVRDAKVALSGLWTFFYAD